MGTRQASSLTKKCATCEYYSGSILFPEWRFLWDLHLKITLC